MICFSAIEMRKNTAKGVVSSRALPTAVSEMSEAQGRGDGGTSGKREREPDDTSSAEARGRKKAKRITN